MKKSSAISNQHESFMEWLMPTKSTWLLLVIYTVLITCFLYFLDAKTQSGFGFVEMLFALVAACVLVGALVWIKIIEYKNPYLGLVVGLVMVGYLMYATSIRFWGPYTLAFLGAGALIALIYTIVFFYKARAQDTQ